LPEFSHISQIPEAQFLIVSQLQKPAEFFCILAASAIIQATYQSSFAIFKKSQIQPAHSFPKRYPANSFPKRYPAK
jgi:hypothetical protein